MYENLAEIDRAIADKEYLIQGLQEELAEAQSELLNLQNDRKIIKLKEARVNPCLPTGTRLLFRDLDFNEIEMIITVNSKEEYNLILMTDYSRYYDYMHQYFSFGYRAQHTNTLISAVCDDYHLTFVKLL